MYSIGEFSSATGIPVRTLRFYHELGLLIPATVDPQTSHRSYDDRNLELAKVIVTLRELELSLEEIREILVNCRDDVDILGNLQRQRAAIFTKLEHYHRIVAQFDKLIDAQRKACDDDKTHLAQPIEERELQPLLIAGIRMKGAYAECGKGFATLGKKLGRYIAGKPLCLFYDGEFRDGDANFETCFPIRSIVKAEEGVSIRELPAQRCLTLVHHGPYNELRTSYARLMKYAKAHGYKIALPTREIYLKGPGMLFRGNPRNYVTEIQIPLAT
jgi:DNA-binding transcriptional MerR regulator